MGKPKSVFKGHGYRIYLDRTLYLATIKLQADLRLGKSFSALLIWVEGLHHLGRLSDADYEVYKAKYSVGLDFEPLNPAQIKQQETKANLDRKRNRYYKGVLEQWSKISDKSKAVHLKNAEKDKHLKWAREVLKLGSVAQK